MFTDAEKAYLGSQRLARLATVSTTGQCDADAVAFEFEGDVFVIGGLRLPATRKYKNVTAGAQKVSLIVNDVASADPWQPRGVKIHGLATIEHRDGRFGPGDYIVVRPLTSWSWGVNSPYFVDRKPTKMRKTLHGEQNSSP